MLISGSLIFLFFATWYANFCIKDVTEWLSVSITKTFISYLVTKHFLNRLQSKLAGRYRRDLSISEQHRIQSLYGGIQFDEFETMLLDKVYQMAPLSMQVRCYTLVDFYSFVDCFLWSLIWHHLSFSFRPVCESVWPLLFICSNVNVWVSL